MPERDVPTRSVLSWYVLFTEHSLLQQSNLWSWQLTDGSFKRAINTSNPMGTKGDLAKAFATLVSMLWKESYTFLSPVTFRVSSSMTRSVSTMS
jgi:ubiquitin C-terminal hydrolase